MSRAPSGTILLDTGCFSPQADRTTALDVSVVTACEERAKITESRADTFERIVAARKDISSLTSFQILHKDLKVVRGLPIPGMPILLRVRQQQGQGDPTSPGGKV